MSRSGTDPANERAVVGAGRSVRALGEHARPVASRDRGGFAQRQAFGFILSLQPPPAPRTVQVQPPSTSRDRVTVVP